MDEWSKKACNYILNEFREMTKLEFAEHEQIRVQAGLPQVRVHDLKHTFGRRLRATGGEF